MPLPHGIRNEENIDFRHATRYQDSVTMITPPPSLQRNLMQSPDGLAASQFCRFSLARAGREGEMEERNLTRVPSTTAMTQPTKKRILHKAETPQSKRIVALGTLSLLSLSRARNRTNNNRTKACFSLSLGDSAR